MPAPGGVETSARVATWAVGRLQGALGRPVQDQAEAHTVILDEGAPLGVLRATETCTACGVCARHCPTRALSLTAGLGTTELVLDPAACTGCGVCVQACPEHALSVVKGVDLDLLGGGPLSIAHVAVATCPDCGDSVPPLPAAGHLTALPGGLAGRCPPCRQAALVASA